VKVTRRILLYGNSVILGAVGTSLRRLSQFEVKALAPSLQIMQELDAVNPDILLFDLETTHSEAVFSMLKINPGLLLVGISPDINQIKIWSGWQVRELSTQDLLELIKSEANHLSIESDSDEDHPFKNVEKK